MARRVLVLNSNYEPLHVCGLRRAMILIGRGKAEVLEHAPIPLRSPTVSSLMPSVVRLYHLVKRPRPRAMLSRKEIYSRDGYACVYCGKQGRDLTLDHVIPRQKGGMHTWENLVTACRACNGRKGNKSVAEAGMVLKKEPVQPFVSAYYILYQYLQGEVGWRKFVPEWELDRIV